MRVLYLSHTSLLGGAELSLLDLLTHINRREFEPILVVPDRGPLADRAATIGVPVEATAMPRLKRRPVTRGGRAAEHRSAAPGLRTSPGALRATIRLRRLIARLRPAIIHANSSRAHAYTVPAACRRWPVVWHARDLAPLGIAGWFLVRGANRVIAISRAVAKSLARHGDPARVTVIHNGIDAESISPDRIQGDRVRAELGLGAGQPLIGMVGQLVPWKRHPWFLEAAARIASAVPQARFAVAGGDLFGDHPDYESELRARARSLGVTERVRFLGHRADALQLIAACDVLLHPTECEPFGRVILEAMALAKPVVAANAAGPAEIIEHSLSGLLVAPGDIDKMAAAVVGLLQRPEERAPIGARAREQVVRNFSITQTVSRIETVYREVARG